MSILLSSATFLTNPSKAPVIWTAGIAVIIKRLETETVINNVDAGHPSAISTATLKLPPSDTDRNT